MCCIQYSDLYSNEMLSCSRFSHYQNFSLLGYLSTSSDYSPIYRVRKQGRHHEFEGGWGVNALENGAGGGGQYSQNTKTLN